MKTRTMFHCCWLAVLLIGCGEYSAQNGEAPPPVVGDGDSTEPLTVDATSTTPGEPELAMSPVNLIEGVDISPENTKIEFVGSKDNGSHNGGFKEISGRMKLDPENLAASEINVEIDTTSLWSDNDRLTGHLQNSDFFDVPNYPTATFAATNIEASDAEGSTHTITGDLTLHGVTKSISFPATISLDGDSHSLTSKFTINRLDFDIDYQPGQVHNDVNVMVTVGKAA